jgi:phosphohistidine phosphatase
MPHRRLVLVRHAQAGNAATDRNRPLTELGQHQAAAAGEQLAGLGVAPDRVLVSPALRAVQTWQGMSAALAGPAGPEIEERIYDNTLEGLFEVIGESGEDVGTLVVVGHNPAVGQLASDLDDGEGDDDARESLSRGFPPASMAVFEIDGPFAMLGPGTATLVHQLAPSA